MVLLALFLAAALDPVVLIAAGVAGFVRARTSTIAVTVVLASLLTTGLVASMRYVPSPIEVTLFALASRIIAGAAVGFGIRRIRTGRKKAATGP